jgi:hypothetical protein
MLKTQRQNDKLQQDVEYSYRVTREKELMMFM